MKITFLRLAACLLVLGGAVAGGWAQPVTLNTALKAAVWRADEMRLYAMMTNDTGALDDLLVADCLYVHSNGIAQTKAELLQALKSGDMTYLAVRYEALPQIRLYGTETAILTGTAHLEVKLANGRTVKPTVLVTAVYVMKNDRWQLASYHSTNSPPPK